MKVLIATQHAGIFPCSLIYCNVCVPQITRFTAQSVLFIGCYVLLQLPDDLPFEDILVTAKKLYEENDPEDIEPEVEVLERRE